MEDADRAIAEKAISILRKDLENGYDHIVMARCKNISRAKEVFEVYKKYSDYSPILVYSGMKNSNGVLKEIKEKRHRIIVCVNMLGEGYDLPQLKITTDMTNICTKVTVRKRPIKNGQVSLYLDNYIKKILLSALYPDHG